MRQLLLHRIAKTIQYSHQLTLVISLLKVVKFGTFDKFIIDFLTKTGKVKGGGEGGYFCELLFSFAEDTFLKEINFLLYNSSE